MALLALWACSQVSQFKEEIFIISALVCIPSADFFVTGFINELNVKLMLDEMFSISG